MGQSGRRLAFAFAGLIGTGSPALAGNYTFQTVSLPGQTGSAAYGINDFDEVVGEVFGPGGGGFLATSGGLTMVRHGTAAEGLRAINQRGMAVGVLGRTPSVFIYEPIHGQQRRVAISPGNPVLPSAIDDHGDIVGTVEYYKSGSTVGFLFAKGSAVALQPPGGHLASAMGINDSGTVAGTYEDAANALHGFIYAGGTHVIGQYTTIDPPGSVSTGLVNIEADGTLVGSYLDASHTRHGFVQKNGVVSVIDYPGVSSTVVVGMTADGTVVGNFIAGSAQHGFVLVGGVFSQIDPPGAGLSTSIQAVSGDGSIAGYVYPGNDYYATTAFYGVCTKMARPRTK